MTENTKPAGPSGENGSDESKETTQNVLDFGSALTRTSHGTVYTLTIIGQIEGHSAAPSGAKTTKYEHVLPLLAKLEESGEVDGVLFLLNTVGGDVEAGLAIAEMVAGMRKPSVSLVIGGGHSIGVPLAVCTRRSFIVPSATMTLHPVRISGMVINAPQSIDYLRQMQARVVNFVCGHSKLPAEQFYRMLEAREDMANDVGTILDGEAAVRCGLIDAVGGLGDALEALNGLMERGGEEAR